MNTHKPDPSQPIDTTNLDRIPSASEGKLNRVQEMYTMMESIPMADNLDVATAVIYANSWAYNSCTMHKCDFTISREVDLKEWFKEAAKHLKEVHDKTDAEIIKSAWYRILGGE